MTATHAAGRKAKPIRAGKPAPGPDAIAFLTQEHRALEALFEDFEKATRKDRKRTIATRICQELLSHMQIEEEIFYPATRDLLKDDGVVKEGLVEHESGRDRVERIVKMDPSDELFDAEVHVLGEQMKHHHHEEEDEYFPEVRKMGLDLKTLGAQLKARKDELIASFDKPN